MTYLVLAASVALVTFLAVNVVCSTLVALLWQVARRDLDQSTARARAGGLFLLAVFPAAAASVVALGVFLPAFFRFEPRQTSEAIGETLVALSAVSAAFIAVGLRRGWLASSATRQVLRGWRVGARPLVLSGMDRAFGIRGDFPVVSVVGIVRPQMFISERVLRECSPEEVSAIVRHECGHLAAGDNLRALVLRACPNLLSLTGARRDLERRWQEACEEAADDFAAGASAPRALALANALLRVARMAPARAAWMPATGFYQGASIERRVRRLLDGDGEPRPSAAPAARPAWLVAARLFALVPPALAAGVLLNPRLLAAVHHVIEAVVETLP